MTKNIDKLIKFLQDETIAFNMNYWVHKSGNVIESEIDEAELLNANKCGTVACMGGSADLLMAIEKDPTVKYIDIVPNGEYEDAFNWIAEGLPNNPVGEYTPDELFEPSWGNAYFGARPGDDDYITREKAIRVLEHFRDTGEIDWDR